jgi:hypothetical protein
LISATAITNGSVLFLALLSPWRELRCDRGRHGTDRCAGRVTWVATAISGQ